MEVLDGLMLETSRNPANLKSNELLVRSVDSRQSSSSKESRCEEIEIGSSFKMFLMKKKSVA